MMPPSPPAAQVEEARQSAQAVTPLGVTQLDGKAGRRCRLLLREADYYIEKYRRIGKEG